MRARRITSFPSPLLTCAATLESSIVKVLEVALIGFLLMPSMSTPLKMTLLSCNHRLGKSCTRTRSIVAVPPLPQSTGKIVPVPLIDKSDTRAPPSIFTLPTISVSLAQRPCSS
jgi:hypothetical protein